MRPTIPRFICRHRRSDHRCHAPSIGASSAEILENRIFLSATVAPGDLTAGDVSGAVDSDPAAVLNARPVIGDDDFDVREGEVAVGNVLANDFDPDGDQLEVTAINGDPAAVGTTATLRSDATLTVTADGTYDYDTRDAFNDLGAGETASDSFRYSITDTFGGALVRITVLGTGTADLIGFTAGGWYVAESTGTAFHTTHWTGWADLEWDALRQGDFNDDGRVDVFGMIDGAVFVGLSTGESFTTSLWTQWANVAWKDVLIGDLNGDGKDDLLARVNGAWWGALSTGVSFAEPSVWDIWADAEWDYVALVAEEFGRQNLIGFIDGEWWGAASAAGSSFLQATRLGTWADVEWDAILPLDGGTSLLGLFNGTWYSGTPQHFIWDVDHTLPKPGLATALRVTWANVAWQDLRAGDFDGDGKDDVLGRYLGEWWVSRSLATGEETSRWDTWANVTWEDVRVADFNGDGKDDLAGRYLGEWWVGLSTGTGFHTTRWDVWRDVDWNATFAADATGIPAVTAEAARLNAAAVPARTRSLMYLGEELQHLQKISQQMSSPVVEPPARSYQTSADEEVSLLSFWSTNSEDDEFAADLFLSADRTAGR